MGTRKLKLESWASDKAEQATRISLYFSRPLSSLEVRGVVSLVEKGLTDGK